MSVADQIQLLSDIQKLDVQIFKLKKELSEQPGIICALEEEFRHKESDYKKKEEEAKEFALKRKEKEGDLQAKETGIKKLEGQLFQLKTNKEYQAMQSEIDGQKADVSVLEEEIIEILDQIEESKKQVAKFKEEFEQERKNSEVEKGKVHQRKSEIESSLQKLNSERAEVTQRVEKEFLTKYEKILCSKNGLAMVNVNKDACGGCNINLPPQVINEIRLKEDLIFCGSCARILFIEENEDQ